MSAWADKPERGSAWLIHLIVWLARAIGRPLCRALLLPIVAYFVATDSTARRASREFLGLATGRRAGLREVFAHVHAFASTLLDRVYMAAGEFDRFELEIDGLAVLDRALAQGHGCVLLGSHLGSFDLMSLAHRALDGREVHLMMRVDPNSRARRIAGIDDQRMNLIQLGRPDSYLRAYEVLKRGGVVAVLADRAEGGVSLQADFLGRPAALPVGPHVLAARAQAPCVLCFGLYEGGRRYRVRFVAFDVGPAQVPAAHAQQPAVDRYAALLAEQARRTPLNWFNFYPFWDSVAQRGRR